jgi:hypothetical protein
VRAAARRGLPGRLACLPREVAATILRTVESIVGVFACFGVVVMMSSSLFPHRSG